MESLIGYVTGLRERWQGTHKKALKTWSRSSFVDMKHRMLLVEEAWKKLKHRSHRTVATTHHPLDVFRLVFKHKFLKFSKYFFAIIELVFDFLATIYYKTSVLLALV